MTRPDQSASAVVSDDALFGSEAADHARYRPGLPDAAVRLLAATQHGVPDPALLAGRHREFEAEALRLLKAPARGGVLKEDAVFTVLLARRPGGAA
ncbi:hypothetical protein [Streptomyces sp. NPDC003247]|uniref:hypothetical protein n=1 Tax=Streptomyces sp. NPDC003247 TaxID=3364677 RepID=UPI00369DA2D6